ncbi:hypothetical protein WR25_12115 [Diploscapter pachys]|uniref:Uncharacterized protein n=1 Tax=Diploscapter pachys TaxID=2018661 RepID=A0A2A2JXH7_9BILA|nr:hypothetical protein WR25_12115 [Diploscapter pachys]
MGGSVKSNSRAAAEWVACQPGAKPKELAPSGRLGRHLHVFVHLELLVGPDIVRSCQRRDLRNDRPGSLCVPGRERHERLQARPPSGGYLFAVQRQREARQAVLLGHLGDLRARIPKPGCAAPHALRHLLETERKWLVGLAMEHSDLVKSTLDRSQREIVEIIGRETTIAKHGAIEPIADRHLDIFDALLAAYILRVDYAKVIEPGEVVFLGFTPRRNVRFDNGIPEPPQSIDQVGVGTLARVRTGDPEQIVRGEADGSRRRATPVEEIRHDARDVEQDLLVVDRRDPVFPRRHLNAHAFGLKRHGFELSGLLQSEERKLGHGPFAQNLSEQGAIERKQGRGSQRRATTRSLERRAGAEAPEALRQIEFAAMSAGHHSSEIGARRQADFIASVPFRCDHNGDRRPIGAEMVERINPGPGSYA